MDTTEPEVSVAQEAPKETPTAEKPAKPVWDGVKKGGGTRPQKGQKQPQQPKQPGQEKAPQQPKQPGQGGAGGQPKAPKPQKANTNTSKRGRGAEGVIEVEPTSGTRDFYPDAMRIQRWLFDQWREVATLFGFQEFDAPILEAQELYQRKSGEEILEQMYSFTCAQDESKLALRPEMTPSLARLLMKNPKLVMPVKWFSIPQCWRYEVVCKGRSREHYQWNMDIVGVPEVSAEAELLAAVVAFFKKVGFTSADIGIKVNSRLVLQEVLTPLGVTKEQFAPVCVIVDKMEKLPECEVVALLSKLGLAENVIGVIQSTLQIKTLDELKQRLPESQVLKDFETLWSLAEAYGYADWLEFNASVVRGLSYYTGIVFEAFAKKSKLVRAISGGGRYDKLLSTYGNAKDEPACGFGFGDCVIIELLKEYKLLPALPPAVEDVVFAWDESLRVGACTVAAKLRAKGRSVDVQLQAGKKTKWCFNYANRIGANRAIFVAPSEWENKSVRIKDLRVQHEDEKFQGDLVLFADL